MTTAGDLATTMLATFAIRVVVDNEFLDVMDLEALAMLSKDFYQMATKDEFWERLCRRQFPCTALLPAPFLASIEESSSYRRHYWMWMKGAPPSPDGQFPLCGGGGMLAVFKSPWSGLHMFFHMHDTAGAPLAWGTLQGEELKPLFKRWNGFTLPYDAWYPHFNLSIALPPGSIRILGPARFWDDVRGQFITNENPMPIIYEDLGSPCSTDGLSDIAVTVTVHLFRSTDNQMRCVADSHCTLHELPWACPLGAQDVVTANTQIDFSRPCDTGNLSDEIRERTTDLNGVQSPFRVRVKLEIIQDGLLAITGFQVQFLQGGDTSSSEVMGSQHESWPLVVILYVLLYASRLWIQIVSFPGPNQNFPHWALVAVYSFGLFCCRVVHMQVQGGPWADIIFWVLWVEFSSRLGLGETINSNSTLESHHCAAVEVEI
jgi:hypothetical protein